MYDVAASDGTLKPMQINPVPSTSLIDRQPEVHFTFNGRSIPLVNHVERLTVLFDRRMTCRLITGVVEAKAY
jgi:hypothetical protein